MNLSQDVGYLDDDNTEGFGPETYVVYGGLGDAVLGEYQTQVLLFRASVDTAWTLTARSEGDVLWVEEGMFTGTSSSDYTTSPDDDDDNDTSRRLFSFSSFTSFSNSSYSDDNTSPRPRSDVFTVVLDSYTDFDC